MMDVSLSLEAQKIKPGDQDIILGHLYSLSFMQIFFFSQKWKHSNVPIENLKKKILQDTSRNSKELRI